MIFTPAPDQPDPQAFPSRPADTGFKPGDRGCRLELSFS